MQIGIRLPDDDARRVVSDLQKHMSGDLHTKRIEEAPNLRSQADKTSEKCPQYGCALRTSSGRRWLDSCVRLFPSVATAALGPPQLPAADDRRLAQPSGYAALPRPPASQMPRDNAGTLQVAECTAGVRY